jgi:hypothetical protein
VRRGSGRRREHARRLDDVVGACNRFFGSPISAENFSEQHFWGIHRGILRRIHLGVTDRGLFYRPIHSVKAALQNRRTTFCPRNLYKFPSKNKGNLGTQVSSKFIQNSILISFCCNMWIKLRIVKYIVLDIIFYCLLAPQKAESYLCPLQLDM